MSYPERSFSIQHCQLSAVTPRRQSYYVYPLHYRLVCEKPGLPECLISQLNFSPFFWQHPFPSSTSSILLSLQKRSDYLVNPRNPRFPAVFSRFFHVQPVYPLPKLLLPLVKLGTDPQPSRSPNMASFHPTKRDFLIVLTITLLFGLFLQFDLSLRFTDSSGSDSLLGVKLGFGGRRDDWEDERASRPYANTGGRGDRWLMDVETGVKYAGERAASMGEAKVRWGEEGAHRTEVLAHAPGESIS